MNPLAKQPRLSDTEAWALSRALHGLKVDPETLNVGDDIFRLIGQLQMIVPEYRRAMVRERLGDEALKAIGEANPHAPMPSEPTIRSAQEIKQESHLIYADDLRKLPKPRYAIEDYPLYLSCLNMLVGPSGGGKSFVAIDIAGKMALQNAKVIYIAGEGLFGYSPRWEVWKAANGISQSKNVIFWDSPVNFMDMEAFQAFMTEIRHYRPDMVIVDTVNSCMMSGDENSTRDMTFFTGQCRRITLELGAGVLAVHHTGKSGTGARGSGVLFSACDSVLALTPSEQQLTLYNSIDQYGKNKYNAPAKPLTLQRVPKSVEIEGELFSSAILVKTTRIELNPDEDTLTTNQRMILEAIEGYEDGLKSSQIIEATQISGSTVYRLLRDMKKWGWLDVFEDHYTLTSKGMEKL